MRVVLDANVLMPGLAVPGVCRDVVRHCLVQHEVVVSEYLIDEVRRNLVRKLGLLPGTADSLLRSVGGRALVVEPEPVDRGACRDPKDLPVLGTTLAGRAKCLITGDEDLLVLGSFRGVAILRPADFWRFENEGAPRGRRRKKGSGS